jgi:hypothetical protein
VGFVDHLELLGRELCGELAGDPVGHGRHAGSLVLLVGFQGSLIVADERGGNASFCRRRRW